MMHAILPMDAPFGAEVTGLDLNDAPDDVIFGEIVDALHAHGVLCVRSQHITPEAHIAFSRRFGDLEVHVQSSFNLPGYPEIYRISNCVDENGNAEGLAEAGRVWHTDLAYLAEPSRCSLLYALEVPHDESVKPLGATMFASTTLAYQALS